MNESWKDLIKQAIQEIGPEDKPSKEETLKRYAELIVRECASLAYDGPGGILDHFGLVEE